MYRLLLITALLITTGPAYADQSKKQSPGVQGAPDGYELSWADEFNQPICPSPSNWIHEKGFIRNRELQWYQPENAFCKAGVLIIEARRETKENPDFITESERWQENRQFAEYTSASLKTKGLRSWRYGRFEMRAKINADQGLWPVFWTLGEKGQWPAAGEIDILESYRGKLLANVAWGGDKAGNPAWDIANRPIAGFGEKWQESFHVWRMDWTEDFIRLYVDDFLLNTIDLRSTVNPAGIEPLNPFQHPHYLLLSLAIGGKRGGSPSQTDFPASFEIDYVRVYQWLSTEIPDRE